MFDLLEEDRRWFIWLRVKMGGKKMIGRFGDLTGYSTKREAERIVGRAIKFMAKHEKAK